MLITGSSNVTVNCVATLVTGGSEEKLLAVPKISGKEKADALASRCTVTVN